MSVVAEAKNSKFANKKHSLKHNYEKFQPKTSQCLQVSLWFIHSECTNLLGMLKRQVQLVSHNIQEIER